LAQLRARIDGYFDALLEERSFELLYPQRAVLAQLGDQVRIVEEEYGETLRLKVRALPHVLLIEGEAVVVWVPKVHRPPARGLGDRSDQGGAALGQRLGDVIDPSVLEAEDHLRAGTSGGLTLEEHQLGVFVEVAAQVLEFGITEALQGDLKDLPIKSFGAVQVGDGKDDGQVLELGWRTT
jgi:hypothetical protein